MMDQKFWEVAKTISTEDMGTEHIGPLVHTLVRMTRPKSVLEIGCGYTTIFALQALAENVREHEMSAQGPRRSLDRPEFFAVPHSPRMTCIDLNCHPSGTAGLAFAAAAELGVARYMEAYKVDFRGFAAALDASVKPFDLVFLDCGGYDNLSAFFDEYWPHVSPDGGLVLVHSTLTNIEGLAFLKDLKLRQATRDFLDYELLSLLEPHKFFQNSVTILRRTAGYSDRIYSLSP
jgi:predicted O-methyltransferase YrrM